MAFRRPKAVSRDWSSHQLLLGLVPGLLLVGLYLWTAKRTAGSLGFPLDDAWIHAQFARNLATGAGFTYTGDRWVSGSTAPAWTVLLAVAYFVTRSMILASMTVGVLLQLATGYYAWRIAERLGVPGRIAMLASTLTVVTPILVWGAVSGMEVPLVSALVLAGLDRHFRDRAREGPRRYFGVALLGVSTLARPETIALVAVVLAGELFGSAPLGARAGTFVRAALVAALGIVPLVGFSYATIARPLPTTFYAKSGPGLLRALESRDAAMGRRAVVVWGPRAVMSFTAILYDQYWLGATLLVGAAVFSLFPGPWRRPGVTCVAILIVVPFGMGVISPQRLKPDNVRYAAQLVALAAPLMAFGAWRVGRHAAIAAAVTLLAVAMTTWQSARAAAVYGRSVKNINELQVATGKWIASHLALDAVVAVNDVGAIAYFGRRRVLDLEGLVSPEVLPYRRFTDRGLKVVEAMRPNYLAIFPAWYPDIVASQVVREIHRVSISDNVISGGDALVVYATPWGAGGR